MKERRGWGIQGCEFSTSNRETRVGLAVKVAADKDLKALD